MEVYQSSHTADELQYALGAVPSIGENGNWFIGDQDTGIFAKGINVTGAEVGQTVKIAAVDENGVPTAWEPFDLPKGGIKFVASVTLDVEATTIEITGLNITAPGVTFRLNAANVTGDATGVYFYVNGVRFSSFRGDVNGGVTVWVLKMGEGYRIIANVNAMSSPQYAWYDTTNFEDPITSFSISGVYGATFGVGSALEVWEGVFPNVGKHNV